IKYNHQLRPEICTPNNQHQLISLLKQENERQTRLVKLLHKMKNIQLQIIHKSRLLFSQRLSCLTDYLLIRFDKLIGSDQIDHSTNIDRGDSVQQNKLMLHNSNKSFTTNHPHDNQLTRTNNTAEEENLDRGKRTWEGVKFSELIQPTNNNLVSKFNFTKLNANKLQKSPMKSLQFSEKQSMLKTARPISNMNKTSVVEDLHETTMEQQDNYADDEDYCIVSAKTTEAHKSTLKSRDIAVTVS
ncbi:unnamed protein product, partial [Schistosoma turkestanicum]